MEFLFQQLLNGLTIGSVYSLVALGLTLVFGILYVPKLCTRSSLHGWSVCRINGYDCAWSSGAESFITAFESEDGRVPTAESAFNYQAFYVIVEAMKLAGTVEDPHAIMEQMDACVKALAEDKLIGHLTGVINNGSDWIASIAAIEEGQIVHVEQ